MKFTIVYSLKDPAGCNIAKQLEKIGFGVEIKSVEQEIIYAEGIDKDVKGDFLIFLSKHQSAKGVACMTVHPIGNWGKAEFGGIENRVVKSSAFAMKHMFCELSRNSYMNVTMEVTHHGPFIEKPCFFVEIGSSYAEWTDEKAGEYVAQAVLNFLNSFNNSVKYIPAIGVGGLHYANNFNKVQLSEKYAVSHIIPSYIGKIKKEMISEAINKTTEKTNLVFIDWKAFKSDERKELIRMIESLGLKWKSTSDRE